RCHGFRESLRKNRLRRRSRERTMPRQHLVYNARETVLITSSVEVHLPCSLLGTDVRWSSHHHPGLRERFRSCGAHCLRNSEIHHHRFTFVQHQVFGLYVPVNDVLAMSVIECRRDAARKVDDVLDWQELLTVQSLTKR